MNKFDLHTHTNHSDGRQSVGELLERAEHFGFDVISITDHQTTSAYGELKDPNIRKLFSGKIVTGIELLFEQDGIVNEVLGYGIDTDKMAGAEFLGEQETERRELAFLEGLYNQTSSIGFDLGNLDNMKAELLATKTIARELIVRATKRPENAHVFKSLGINSHEDLKKFFIREIQSPAGKHHVPYNDDSIETVSRAIRDAGGLVFMAHIFRANGDMQSPTLDERTTDLLDYAVKNKLIDGIEVYYEYFTAEQKRFLEKYCEQHNLLMSGGSDFHGDTHPGQSRFGMTDLVPETAITPWLNHLNYI